MGGAAKAAPSAFLTVQLRLLGTRVITQSGQKVKEQPSVLLVLCWARRTRVMQALPQDVAFLACVP
ncbi:dihydrolipoamide acetyltransferase [Bacillus sp. NRRL B-14911]|nr:dihydrolipoamide acetyltransferase [Bacillus sp. NRRL B-14911]